MATTRRRTLSDWPNLKYSTALEVVRRHIAYVSEAPEGSKEWRDAVLPTLQRIENELVRINRRRARGRSKA